MQDLIDVILPVFILIAAGYLAVWRGLFSQTLVDGVMKFAQSFALPCLLFKGVSALDLGVQIDPLMLLSFYTGAVAGFAAGLLGARFLFGRPWEECVAIGFIGLFSNSLLLGVPITERAYGVEALANNFTILAMHAPFCYALGITAMELARNAGGGVLSALPRIGRAMSRNPLVIGVCLGLIVNVTGLPLPTALDDAITMMTRAALPAALFGLGGTLYYYRPEGDMRLIFYVVAISIVMHPTITWLLGRWFAIPDAALRSAVITAAMAPGANAYLFANMYGVARRVAASAVLIATVLSIGTVWVWLRILP